MRKLKVAITPRQWLLKTTLDCGVIVYGKNQKGFGGRGIYIYRDSIEPEFQHLDQFLEPGHVFIDVGANTGIFSLKSAKYVGENGVVLSVEPFIDVLANLSYSVEANGFKNVRLRNLSAGEETKAEVIWMNGGKPNSFSLLKKDESASYFSTLCVKLDDLFQWEKLERLDYLKMDVEGAEQKVLNGAKTILEKYPPIIQIEVMFTDVTLNLSNYSFFKAPNSPNKFCIPNESDKVKIPEKLGWTKLE